ncbi:hypothetical protein BJ546DRAFT_991868 [Cryomyces antarcticus]
MGSLLIKGKTTGDILCDESSSLFSIFHQLASLDIHDKETHTSQPTLHFVYDLVLPFDMSSPNTSSSPKTSGERRRSSAGLFSNLMAQKRNPEDANAAARRTSITEQNTTKPGFLGNAWNNMMKGSGPGQK